MSRSSQQEITGVEESLVDRVRARAAQELRDSTARLRELIVTGGDPGAALAAARQLGLFISDIEGLIRVFEVEREAEQALARRGAIENPVAEISAAGAWRQAEHARVEQEANARLAPLLAQQQAYIAATNAAAQADAQLGRVRRIWQMLGDGDVAGARRAMAELTQG